VQSVQVYLMVSFLMVYAPFAQEQSYMMEWVAVNVLMVKFSKEICVLVNVELTRFWIAMGTAILVELTKSSQMENVSVPVALL